jgi:hypothetical protein
MFVQITVPNIGVVCTGRRETGICFAGSNGQTPGYEIITGKKGDKICGDGSDTEPY